MSVTARLIQSGRDILDRSASAKLSVRLIGGVGIWLRVSNATRELFSREYGDLDFVTYAPQAARFATLLKDRGYVPDKEFNALNGERRLIYYSGDRAFHLDIFLDKFEMSHMLDLRHRLEIDDLTIPGAELLLTKLQVAEINRKDLTDVLMLLADHELSATDGANKISVPKITSLCAADWGLYTTVSDNIAKAKTFANEIIREHPDVAERVANQLGSLEERMIVSPKTFAWKLRARVGRRMQWFEVPEESLQ